MQGVINLKERRNYFQIFSLNKASSTFLLKKLVHCPIFYALRKAFRTILSNSSARSLDPG